MMAGLIPEAFRDELLSRTDLVELVDAYIPLKKQGNSHVACCPFHSEKTPSFNVIGRKQFYHCFGCGASGNAISFVMQYQGVGFRDAVALLAARVGLSMPETATSEKQTPGLHQLLGTVSQYYQKALRTDGAKAIAYLRGRGLDGEIAKRYHLGYAREGWHVLERDFARQRKALIETGMLVVRDDGKTCDRYRHRIMFPIHDRQGRITGFGGRAIDPAQKPKYLNSPETPIFRKSHELYGLYQVLQKSANPESVIVVEGYLDVIALAQHGLDHAVATLGTATSTWHVRMLAKYTRRIIFCFDGDQAGRQAAWRALESSLPHLDEGLDVCFVFLPEGEDPDSVVRKEGRQAFRARLDAAQPLNRFFIETLRQDIDLGSFAGKARLLHLAKPWLQKMPEGPCRQMLEDELARLTRIEGHRLRPLVSGPAEPESPQKTGTITRSPVRVAVALLLQHPEIYTGCASAVNPGRWSGKGQEILGALVERLAVAPDSTTASLVEHWRDTPWFESLGKLAVWDHQVPEQARMSEFLDIMQFLERQDTQQAIQQLLEKSRTTGLNDDERKHLQHLLKQRHPPVTKSEASEAGEHHDA